MASGQTDKYPTNASTNGVVDRPWVFGVVGSSPTSTKYFFSDFPHVELEKYSRRYPQEMKPLGY